MDALIDLNDAALFVQVIHAASFSAAAKKRGVPVSTVSRRIARLEAALGARLIERTTRKLHLTEVGRAYFHRAERALDELDRATADVREAEVVPRGRVRITAPAGLGNAIASTLAPLVVSMPAVVIELDLTDRRVDLQAEGIDIAVRAGRVDDSNLGGKQLFSTTRQMFASKRYLDRHGRPRTLTDLARHALIATRASSAGSVWDLYSATRGGGRRRHRFAFMPRLVVNDLLVARHAAREGLGIALLPLVEADRSLEPVLPSITGERSSLWVLYAAHRNLTAAVRACADQLIAVLPEKHTL